MSELKLRTLIYLVEYTAISFGRGSTINYDTMITYNDAAVPYRINAVAFSTTELCKGEFSISDSSGNTSILIIC